MTEDETIEVETTPIDEAGALALSAVERAAIDSQVATAKQYPRTVSKCIEEAMTLATMDEDTAASCFYSLPRGGKTIEGPSARLAEIMVSSWGNIRADADIVAEDRTHITAVGTCFDVEKNVAVRVRVRRRITKKNGSRYDDDMIGVAGNAAISIALRNAVFKVIPRALSDRVYVAARRASIGQAGTITQNRQKALAWFQKAGVTEEQVFAVLKVRGLDDIGEEQLITLRGMSTAIQQGDTSVEQMFRKHDVSDGSAELNESLGKKESDDTLGRLGDETVKDAHEQQRLIDEAAQLNADAEANNPQQEPREPAIRDKRQKDDLVLNCEVFFNRLTIHGNEPRLKAAAELLVDVPESAKTLKGLTVAALTDLEAKLREEVSDGR